MKKILLGIIVLALSGCSVYGTSIGEAELKCASNEGIHHITPKLTGKHTAVCNNGAEFTLKFVHFMGEK
jgi:hypothetical protein